MLLLLLMTPHQCPFYDVEFCEGASKSPQISPGSTLVLYLTSTDICFILKLWVYFWLTLLFLLGYRYQNVAAIKERPNFWILLIFYLMQHFYVKDFYVMQLVSFCDFLGIMFHYKCNQWFIFSYTIYGLGFYGIFYF